MRYLALLGRDEATMPEPGTDAFADLMTGYARFSERNGEAIVGGAALQVADTAVTIRAGDGGQFVTDGPYAEAAEAVGGFYVFEAETLDDAIELARQVPATQIGWAVLRPMVEWWDHTDAGDAGGLSGDRYMALMYGKETPGDTPDTAEWDAGAAEHGRFVREAGGAVLAGGALHPLHTSTTVRVAGDEVLVTDGPYTEVAEVTGGFYVLRAGSTEEAVKVATAIPSSGPVEVRPILDRRS
jgi:hypothetical protein